MQLDIVWCFAFYIIFCFSSLFSKLLFSFCIINDLIISIIVYLYCEGLFNVVFLSGSCLLYLVYQGLLIFIIYYFPILEELVIYFKGVGCILLRYNNR
jgi:hypothetical protein